MSRQQAPDGSLSTVNAMETRSVPTRLTLISHAPTLALKRAYFPSDEPLLEDAADKIIALQWTSPRAQQVLCGPELRTRQTAKALGLEPVIDPALTDVDYGAWKGKRIDEIQETDPEALVQWLTDPDASPHGGESCLHLINRAKQWMAAQVGSGHTVAVTHPAVIRAAVLSALEAPPGAFWKIEIAPLTITDLRFNGRFWIARTVGCSPRDASAV